MKELHHNQQIKVKNFRYQNKIKVSTVQGLFLGLFGKENIEELKEAESIGYSKKPWTTRSPSMMTGDYPDKNIDLKKLQEAFDNAVEVEDGETVKINQKEYTVKVIGEQYYDPVHFIVNT